MKQDKYTAVIIDDEQAAREVLKSLLSDFPEVNVIGTANDGIDGYYLLEQKKPDIAFIDIDMPGKNGIELLSDLHNVNDEIKVVFTTAYEKYALESIKYHPFGYLLKPISSKQLKETICHVIDDEKVIESKHNGQYHNKLKVSSKHEVRYIDFLDIIYIEADGNYSKLYLLSKETINITKQVGQLEKMLLGNSFIRINRSVIINLDYFYNLKRKERVLQLKYNNTVQKFKVSKRQTTNNFL